MVAVMVQLRPDVFDPGKPLAGFANQKHKARYIINSRAESAPHIAHKLWFPNRDYPEPPNSITVALHRGGPSWFDTLAEFNQLPYAEVRAQIANEVERGILEVLTITGGATAAGEITAVAKANLIDGETVVFVTTAGVTLTFHFDVSGTYVPGGGYDATNLRVNISGDTDADDVATTLAAVINGTALVAPAPAAGVSTFAITQSAPGTIGNTVINETISDTDFIASGFGGGGAVPVADIRNGTVV